MRNSGKFCRRWRKRSEVTPMSTLTQKKSGNLSCPKTAQGKPRSSRAFASLDAILKVDDWPALLGTKPRYELIEGKLIQKRTATSDHAWAAGEFLHTCKNRGQKKGWKFFPEGMGDKADTHNGFVPDVVGFSPDQKVEPPVTSERTARPQAGTQKFVDELKSRHSI